jgi:hypothetical protein
MDFFYKRIDEADVDPEVLRRARSMLDYSKRMLGPVSIEIVWVIKVDRPAFEFADALAGAESLLRRSVHDYSAVETTFEKHREEFLGQTWGGGSKANKIFVRADIALREILVTIAHEAKHVHDYGIFRPPWSLEEKVAWEIRAEEFAREMMRKIEPGLL